MSEEGRALSEESLVIDPENSRLIHIYFEQAQYDEDGEPIKDKKGNIEKKKFPAAKIIRMVSDYINDNTDDIRETTLWLAKNISWGVGGTEMYKILLAYYAGVITGQKELKLEIDANSATREEIADLFEKALREKAKQWEDLADNIRDIMGISGDEALLPGGD